MSEVPETKPSSSLYTLTKEFNELSELLIMNGGELTPEMEARFKELDIETAGKIDGYKFMIDRLEAEAMFWSNEAAQRSRIASSAKTLASKIKENLKSRMTDMGKDEVIGNVVRALLTPTKGSLVIDETLLTEDYTITETVEVTKPLKDKIRADLEQFISVPGAKLEGGYSIRFYNVKPATVEIPAAEKPKKAPKAKKGEA